MDMLVKVSVLFLCFTVVSGQYGLFGYNNYGLGRYYGNRCCPNSLWSCSNPCGGFGLGGLSSLFGVPRYNYGYNNYNMYNPYGGGYGGYGNYGGYGIGYNGMYPNMGMGTGYGLSGLGNYGGYGLGNYGGLGYGQGLYSGGSIFDNPYSLEGNYGGYGNYGMMSPYSMNDYGGMYGSPNGMGIVRPLRKQAKSLVQRDVYDNKDFKGTLASSEDSFPEESSGANSAVILTMDQLLKK